MTASTSRLRATRSLIGAAAVLTLLSTGTAWAQNYPITAGQRATANQVAQAGVPLSEIAANAPEEYKVKPGDTLWAISKVFLKSPWRWPELWGMNLDDIKNPHLIYPGQMLYLVRDGDRARLMTRKGGTIKVSPKIRTTSLKESAIPPVNLQAIQTFLDEPLIVDQETFSKAPRIVATEDKRVLLTQGDRAYARSGYGEDVSGEEYQLLIEKGKTRDYRVFREAVPLKDPGTGEVLGYEAQYVGKAFLVRSEGTEKVEQERSDKPTGEDTYEPSFESTTHNVARTELPDAKKKEDENVLVPATIDILGAKEEMRTGDRLLPEPSRDFSNYVPSAPAADIKGQIVSVYGNGVTFAGQNNVVTINRGESDGIRRGHVFSLLRDRKTVVDKTDDSRPAMQLPGELNGLMMVFLTFDRVSYALLLETNGTVEVGDHFVAP